MNQTCSVITTSITTSTNPYSIFGSNNYNNNNGNDQNSTQQLISYFFNRNLLSMGVIGGGIVCVGLVVIYSNKNKINQRNNNQINQNIYQNKKIEVNKLLCAKCNSIIFPEDKYCQNCGTMIITIDDLK